MSSSFFTFQKLYLAYKKCQEKKSKTLPAIGFSYHLERELLAIKRELETKAYVPGKSICFVVEDPVIREIFAAPFRDRVVQHFIINEIETSFEKYFIHTSCACRKQKGTHFGLRELKKGIQSCSWNYEKPIWYLKMDISGFFMSMDRNILFSVFSEILKKEVQKNEYIAQNFKDILWLIRTIIFHNPTENYQKKGQLSLFDLVPRNKSLFYSAPNTGLPIGNLTSQFFANVYLNALDHFVKRTLKCRQYFRYVDDFVLLSDNQKECRAWKKQISQFCQKQLKLTVHPKKCVIQRVSTGIDFIGYRVFPKYTLVRRRIVLKLKQRIKKWEAFYKKEGVFSEKMIDHIMGSLHSYFGFFGHADSFSLRKFLCETKLSGFKNFITSNETFRSFCSHKSTVNTASTRDKS